MIIAACTAFRKGDQSGLTTIRPHCNESQVLTVHQAGAVPGVSGTDSGVKRINGTAWHEQVQASRLDRDRSLALSIQWVSLKLMGPEPLPSTRLVQCQDERHRSGCQEAV